MSVFAAMSAALATIFSFEKSRKWIIREGGRDLAQRLRSADGERLEEGTGVTHGRRIVESPGL